MHSGSLNYLCVLMRIALIQKNYSNSPWPYTEWVQQSLQHSAAAKHAAIVQVQYPGDVADKPLTGTVLFVITCPATGKWSRWYWYRFQLPALVSKIKADKLVDVNGRVGIGIKQPQVLLADAVDANAHRTTRGYIANASAVFTYSAYAKQTLEKLYPGNANKIQVWLPVHATRPIITEWDVREQRKEKHAEGREYFLATGLTHLDELLNLLKAFSNFKKWQKSQMKLLIAGTSDLFTDAFDDKLATYRYRDDVGILIPESAEQFGEVLSAAYGLVHLPDADADIEPLLLALQYGVPSILPAGKSLEQLAGNSALTVEDLLPESIGKQLQLLFKDESLRSSLMDKARQQFINLQHAGAANPLWVVKKQAGKK